MPHEYVDISLPIHAGMLTYGSHVPEQSDPPFESTELSHSDPNHPLDHYRLTKLFATTHTGTHVDAPRHVIAGAATVGELDPEVLCGEATVLDLVGAGTAISEVILRSHRATLANVRRLLLRTDNCALLGQPVFRPDYAHLTADGACYLRHEIGVRLVGIDYLSVDGFPSPWPGFGFPAHHALLDGDNPVVVLEGIDLRAVAAGRYELLCLPLRIVDGDGAPARAMLRKKKN